MYRQLTREEIARLEAQGCCAESWDAVRVAEDFRIDSVRNCTFGGSIEIGRDVVIAGVRRLANYTLGDGVRIEDVGVLETTGRSRFGNGVRVRAINEAGGREVPIFDGLTAQTAYLVALYRHRPAAVAALEKFIEAYSENVASDMGIVGVGAVLRGCNTVRNTRIGPAAVLEGAAVLENVSVGSSPEEPAYIGFGVKIRDSIVAPGGRIDNGAILRRCFSGEATRIDDGFTAEDSLFYANCDLRGGEAVAVFAGPYTVSHHKSSLLIAGIFSFFNAGSGANQSNHLFKTGAVHQGVHERGTKFASNAYVMLPAREGPFTTVIGRHTSHHDSRNFPYSYLVESEGKSFLMPGAGLRSYGTVRDLAKWPQRDGRKIAPGPGRDLIHHHAHNPFVAGRVAAALNLCDGLLARENVETYTVERMQIRRAQLRRGAGLFRMALDASIGVMISEKPAGTATGGAAGAWVDLAGMFAPQAAVEEILDRLESGAIGSVAALDEAIYALWGRYKENARQWAHARLAAELGHAPSGTEIADAIRRGEAAATTLQTATDEDARRDRDPSMSVGYGIDADAPATVVADFEAVKKEQG